MKRVATIILNRNLPEVTDSLCDHIQLHDGDATDIFVVEAGSDTERLSRYSTWHADWPDATAHGLRYCRGMNNDTSQNAPPGTVPFAPAPSVSVLNVALGAGVLLAVGAAAFAILK